MKILQKILEKAITKGDQLSHDELLYLLECDSPEEEAAIFHAANIVKSREIGNQVSLRGLIEISNICTKNCYYCGIRCEAKNFSRFTLTEEEILSAANEAYKAGYRSLVLQAGERSDDNWTNFIEEVLRKIKQIGNGALGVTLSLGEQSLTTYQRWFATGAHRYLLRIESSNPKLYAQLHPDNYSWKKRLECLQLIRQCAYQLGTGVMIGLPGQTHDDLVADLEFFRHIDADMLGMGPYIPSSNTPMGQEFAPQFNPEKQLRLGLKMIALARLYLRNVNIASTTALQSLHPEGRNQGLQAGANVIMPNLECSNHQNYQLYDHKANTNETIEQIQQSLSTINLKLSPNWGDSPHFLKK